MDYEGGDHFGAQWSLERGMARLRGRRLLRMACMARRLSCSLPRMLSIVAMVLRMTMLVLVGVNVPDGGDRGVQWRSAYYYAWQ